MEFVAKPSGLSNDLVNVGEQLAEAVMRASQRAPAPGVARLVTLPAPPMPRSGPRRRPRESSAQHLVVIGSSTGGPPALTEVVPHLPGDLPAGVIVVQHMPAGFTGALAKRLDSLSPLHVHEAADGDLVAVGQVLVAPGRLPPHRRRATAASASTRGRPVHGVRPSVDITLESVAAVYGNARERRDPHRHGKRRRRRIRRRRTHGGAIIAQDEASCVVYGMPRVANERTQHAVEVPLDQDRHAARTQRCRLEESTMTEIASNDQDWLSFRRALERAIGVPLGQYKEPQMKRRLASIMTRRGFAGWPAFEKAIAPTTASSSAMSATR